MSARVGPAGGYGPHVAPPGPPTGPERGRARDGSRSTRAVSAAARRAEQAWAVLQRLVPLAARLVGMVRAFTVAAAVAVAVMVVSIGWMARPLSLVDMVLLAMVAGTLSVPVVILALFARALGEVLELPGRLTAVPELARSHGAELAVLVRDAQARRGRTSLTALPADLWRAGRLLLAAHRDMPGYGAVLTLVRVPFLVAVAVAAAVALWEIVAAPFAVVVAVGTTLL